jgi:DNA-binding HxlR family transcriptional regulator
MAPGARKKVAVAVAADPPGKHHPACCPHYHEAVELVGKRWTGAIIAVMISTGRPVRFSEVAGAIPQLSDRLLSERMKELEARGLVERRVLHAPPARVEYELTEMGRDLERAVAELRRWARHWMA